MLSRRPRHPALRGLVETLWVWDDRPSSADREWALPNGRVHLAFRACGTPIRTWAADGRAALSHRGLVVGGPREAAYARDTPGPVRSIGAQLAPAAAAVVLGAPARALYGGHVPLSDLWGADARRLEDALHDATDAAALDLVEEALVARISGAPHPALVHAARRLEAGASVGAVAGEIGYSARWLSGRFAREVGLPPSTWARVGRLQRVLRLAARRPSTPWADHAHAAGYFDQAHLWRDFRALTGLRPSDYAPLSPDAPNHVPFRSVQGAARREG